MTGPAPRPGEIPRTGLPGRRAIVGPVMDAMQNDSASGTTVEDAAEAREVAAETTASDTAAEPAGGASSDAAARESAAEAADDVVPRPRGAEPEPEPQPESEAESEPEPDPEPTAGTTATAATAAATTAANAANAANAATESGGGKAAKKRKAAPKSRTAGTKSLVVLRDGRVHYADEAVVVLDLDDAAHPDTDVHDVVDKLTELRDAVDSPGRTEAVSLVGELIQAKALA